MDLLGQSLEILQRAGYQFAILLNNPSSSLKNSPHFDELIITDKIDGPLREQIQLLSLKIRTLSSFFPHSANSSFESFTSNSHVLGSLPLVDLCASDFAVVEKYFNLAFKLLRQLPCKQISKCWIKVVEPKKKAHYPYTLGERSKPSWWPEGVEHREPDHLQKPDRLALMIAIMSVVTPLCYQGNRQIYKDMKDSTHALFKNDKEGFLKELILENVYNVSQAIAEAKLGGQGLLKVLDLNKIKSTRKYSELIRVQHQNIQTQPVSHTSRIGTGTPLKNLEMVNDKNYNRFPSRFEDTDYESYRDSEETISSQFSSEYYDSNEDTGEMVHAYHQLHEDTSRDMAYNDAFEAYLDECIPSSNPNSKPMLL